MAEIQHLRNGELTAAERAKMAGDGQRTPRFLIIGAGSRGTSYGRAVTRATSAIIAAVADPIEFKRKELGRKYIWTDGRRQEDQEFDSWQDYVRYESVRRERERAGERVLPGFDGAFVCTLDDTHAEIIKALAPFGLHILCEKPLATRLGDCLDIYEALKPPEGEAARAVFSIGHVLRYSPHNILLRKLVVEDRVIGDVLSMEHTEPVGWWHFAHSYVRGNWRKESVTAPSLLTKSCHDIDFLLWLLCSPASGDDVPPHLPSSVSSSGSVSYFKKSRKPKAAKDATNCLSCPMESECIYSSRNVYIDRHLNKGITWWPVKIVDPEIEDCLRREGQAAAEKRLTTALAEDYDDSTPQAEVDGRPWFGRCVWESANDVCDDQTVTMTWQEDAAANRGAKTALFHMVAFTEALCERRGRIYGTKGELEYDSETIRVHDFGSQKREVHRAPPAAAGSGHGGGDDGLAAQFIKAVDAVMNRGAKVEDAQREHIGCTVEDAIRSHAMVFAAEEARREAKVVEWQEWWERNVERRM